MPRWPGRSCCSRRSRSAIRTRRLASAAVPDPLRIETTDEGPRRKAAGCRRGRGRVDPRGRRLGRVRPRWPPGPTSAEARVRKGLSTQPAIPRGSHAAIRPNRPRRATRSRPKPRAQGRRPRPPRRPARPRDRRARHDQRASRRDAPPQARRRPKPPTSRPAPPEARRSEREGSRPRTRGCRPRARQP